MSSHRLPCEGTKATKSEAAKMIGIRESFNEIPERFIETARLGPAVGADEFELRNNIGFACLTRKAPTQEASDLCVAAAQKLFSKARILPAEVDCAIVVTQNPDGYGIPHVAAIAQAKLGLSESCATFDIGLGGSGYVYGLSVIKSFMESNGLRRGLLFTCDPYSRVVGEFDNKTALLFGDAASVTLLTDEPIWAIGRCDFGTVGSQGSALQVRMKLGGRLHMDNSAVSKFAREHGSRSLRRAISLNELTIEQIDRILFHQGSRAEVEAIAEELGAPGKVGFYAEAYGDTVSSSIPIMISENVAPTDQRIALCGYGTGLSWSSTVLTRVPEVR